MYESSNSNTQVLLKKILRGCYDSSLPNPPSRTIKIFISSSGNTEFNSEQIQLHEFIFPELQRHCAQLGLDLLIVDRNWQYINTEFVTNSAFKIDNLSRPSSRIENLQPIKFDLTSQITDEIYSNQVLYTIKNMLDSYFFTLELEEIEDCFNQSINIFFLTLIGQNYEPFVLPLYLSSDQFEQLNECGLKHKKNSLSTLFKYYILDENALNEKKRYHLINLNEKFSKLNSTFNLIDSISSDQQTTSALKINVDLFEFCTDLDCLIKLMRCSKCKKNSDLNVRSGIFIQLKHAIQINQQKNDRIIACVKRFEDVTKKNFNHDYSDTYALKFEEILDELLFHVSKSSIHFFTVPLNKNIKNDDKKTIKNHLNSNDLPVSYKNKFTDYLYSTMRDSIEKAAKLNQETYDYPNELFYEIHSHITNCIKFSQTGITYLLTDQVLNKVEQLMENIDLQSSLITSTNQILLSQNSARHSPIVIIGSEGTGKSTILSQIYTTCPQWLSESFNVVRIVRLIGQSPESCYSSELLRSLCLNISLALGNDIPTSLTTAIDHELSSMNTWFNELLKIIELNFSDHVIIIILDDVHRVKSLKSVTLLSWFPFLLPSNVHLICSVNDKEDEFLDVLRSRIAADNFINLQTEFKDWSVIESIISNKLNYYERTLTKHQWEFLENNLTDSTNSFTTMLYFHLLVSTELIYWNSQISVDQKIDYFSSNGIEKMLSSCLQKLEKEFGTKLLAKICTYIAFTRYGLREIDIQELISSEESLQFNAVSSWLSIKKNLKPFLTEKYILGRPYFNWNHSTFCLEIQRRYVKNDSMRRRIHTELANAFYLGFMILQENNTSHSKNNQLNTDIMREMDELWHHLVLANNLYKLKTFVVLNIDFLMACVQHASISYLRSILELIRGRFFDWETELLFNMTKNCIAIVSQEPIQFAVELLIWLKQFSSIGSVDPSSFKDYKESPRHLASQKKNLEQIFNVTGSPIHNKSKQLISNFSQTRSFLLDNLIRSTFAWLMSITTVPVLLPLNNWLNLSLPSQVTAINLKKTCITNAVLSENKQNLIFSEARQLFIFHLTTKETVKIIEAHKEFITCLSISASGRYLATGSKDSIVNIYEIVQQDQLNCKLKYKLSSQTNAIMCCAITNSEELILTGSISGSVCIHLLETGVFITKLNLHCFKITELIINSTDDIFATCSVDGIVKINSLRNFCQLNTIFINKPVLFMDISANSTFIMQSCNDDSIYICALSTGTFIHKIDLPPSNQVDNISKIKFSSDSCRALIGTKEGKLYIYDVHSAQLLQCHSSHSNSIIAILTYPFDNFLLTCGSSKAILWNFIARKTGFNVLSNSSSLIPVVTSNTISSSSTGQSSNTTSNPNLTLNPNVNINQSLNSIKNLKINKRLTLKNPQNKVDNHRDLIICMDVSKCGNYLITGSRDSFVKTWFLNTGATQYTFEGHLAQVNCVAFANNLSFCVSGSDDKVIKIWTLNEVMTHTVSQFNHHQYKLHSIFISSDSKRILSVDIQGVFRYWQVDTGAQLIIVSKQNSSNQLQMIGNMVFQVSGKTNNSVTFWSVYDSENEKSVSHTESITCYVATFDCETLITGSMDGSLKVWEINTGKLTQVLVGHQQQVTCVAVSPFSSNKVLSGSRDSSLIVWDMSTGSDLFQLNKHRDAISHCTMSLDGSTAISCGEDNQLIVWNVSDSSEGQVLIIMDLHSAINILKTSHNLNHVILLPNSSSNFALFQFVRNPAEQRSLDELTPIHKTKNETERFTRQLSTLGQISAINRLSNAKRLMKREKSFDSFYYDHHLQRGLSVDDFTKLPTAYKLLSPQGSRDNLFQANTSGGLIGIANEKISSTASSALSKPSRLVSKLMSSGKQKMLKKQQSMFACFPEHSISSNVLSAIGKPQNVLTSPSSNIQSPHTPVTPCNNFQNLTTSLTKDFDSNKKIRSIRNEFLNRSQSLEENKGEKCEILKSSSIKRLNSVITAEKSTSENKVINSSICSIS